MSSLSREVIRRAFAALLASELEGEGKPAAAVYNYQPGDFGGASPVVTV